MSVTFSQLTSQKNRIKAPSKGLLRQKAQPCPSKFLGFHMILLTGNESGERSKVRLFHDKHERLLTVKDFCFSLMYQKHTVDLLQSAQGSNSPGFTGFQNKPDIQYSKGLSSNISSCKTEINQH